MQDTDKQHTIGRQFARFLMSGGGAACTDLGTFSLLANVVGVHPLVANLVSRPLGGLVSFLLNKFWTFGNRSVTKTHVQFVRYCTVWITAFALSELLIGIFHEGLGLTAFPSKILAEGIVGLFTFSCHKLWTYR